jgi:dTDP-4-dehydrorhamnose 3,5-epimerase
MIFTATKLKDAYLIDLNRLEDERGFFARTWCQREFAEHGLNPGLVQCSISFNKERGTLRGMHYQVPPYQEAKLVRCTAGAIYDVIIDLRLDSPTYRQHLGVELSAQARTALYVPEGFAHGFITLLAGSEVFYQMSEFYAPQAGRGLRWNDPTFAIDWPEPVQVISERDATYPDLVDPPAI